MWNVYKRTHASLKNKLQQVRRSAFTVLHFAHNNHGNF